MSKQGPGFFSIFGLLFRYFMNTSTKRRLKDAFRVKDHNIELANSSSQTDVTRHVGDIGDPHKHKEMYYDQ